MLTTDNSKTHRYAVLDQADYMTMQQLMKLSTRERYPKYNLVTRTLCKNGIPVKTWDGERFVDNQLQMQPLSTYGAYNLIYGNRRFDHSFIYLGECKYYHSTEEKEEAQQKRDALETEMKAAGKTIKHLEIGEKSPLHGLSGHSSHVMRGFSETIAHATWYGQDKNQSTYVTPTAWRCPLHYDKNGKERRKETIASFQAIVIDIDCELLHDRPELASKKRVMDRLRGLTETLLTLLFSAEYGSLPLPVVVHDTGRGLQLWYVFESIAAAARPLYDKLVRAFRAAYTRVFDEYGYLLDSTGLGWAEGDGRSVYTLDRAVLTRQATGWVRAFNTYNGSILRRTQAYAPYTWGELDGKKVKLLPSDSVRPAADELLFQLCEAVPELKADFLPPQVLTERCPQCGRPLVLRTGPHGQFIGCTGYKSGCTYHRPTEENQWKEIDATAIQKASAPRGSSALANEMRRRMAAVRWLISHRQGRGQRAGWRDIALFHYYNSAVAIMPRSKAWEEAERLNARLTQPLGAGEMADVRKAVDSVKTGCYRYKTENWLAALELTDEERAHIEHMSGSHEAERATRREEKDLRDARIEALRIEGKSHAEIAAELAVSVSTVKRRTKKAGLSRKEIRDAKIREMSSAGETNRAIAQSLGISISTVKRALKNKGPIA